MQEEDKEHLLLLLVRTSSGLSLLASCLVLISFVAIPRLRTNINQLVCFTLLAETGSCILFLIGDSTVTIFHSPTLCYLQGFLLQVFELSTICWVNNIATHCLLAVRLKLPLSQLSSFMKYYHIVAWGIPLTLACMAAGLEAFHIDGAGGPVYTLDSP